MQTRVVALAVISLLLIQSFAAIPTSGELQNNFAPAAIQAAHIPAPEDVLGFRPGDDRKLASWNQLSPTSNNSIARATA